MKKFLIDYENVHWCGGQLYVVVNAKDEYEAQEKAEQHMEECQRELFDDHYNYDPDENYDDESAVSVNSVEEFDVTHEYWRFYKDPSQAEFYPEIY